MPSSRRPSVEEVTLLADQGSPVESPTAKHEAGDKKAHAADGESSKSVMTDDLEQAITINLADNASKSDSTTLVSEAQPRRGFFRGLMTDLADAIVELFDEATELIELDDEQETKPKASRNRKGKAAPISPSKETSTSSTNALGKAPAAPATISTVEVLPEQVTVKA